MAASTKQRDPSKHPWRYIEKPKGGLFKAIKQIPFDQKVDVPHGVCFNCWEYGHSRQYCTLPDRQDHCRNCGRIGVKLKMCPRCSEAYYNFWKTKDPQNKIKGLILDLAKVRKIEKWNKNDDMIHCLYFDNVDPIPFDPALDIPYKACSDCWKPRNSGSCDLRSHDHCSNCGRIGVHVGTCPRCSKAYPHYCGTKLSNAISAAAPLVNHNKVVHRKLDVRTSQMVDNNLLKVKEPEITISPQKPLALNTIAPASTGIRSFSAVLKNKDEGNASQTTSLSSGSIKKEQENAETPLKFYKTSSPASTAITVTDRNKFAKSNGAYKFSRDYFTDFKTLITSINHLSITNQNIIVLQFIIERQAHIEQLKCQKRTI